MRMMGPGSRSLRSLGRDDKVGVWEEIAMKLPRREFLRLAATTAALHAAPRLAHAQTYPTRPVRWIVPYPAGGATDLVARLIGQWLSERLGQQFVIENRPGGGTNIGVQAVVNSPPDGYTLLFFGSTNAINTTLYEQLPFNFLRDIAPVAGLVALPMVLEVNPSVPVKTVAEFIAHAKANPGKISVASFGAATISHLAIELFKSTTGVDMVHVPYRGGAPLVTDLISGQVQAAFDALPSSLPHIRRGALRALALTFRSEVLPDVPAISDTVPGYEVSTWLGLGVPTSTAPAVIELLNREVNAGLANPAIKAKLAEVGATPVVFTPAAFRAYVAAETEKWAKVIRASGVKPE
jgi:tripartite-type tricarboxylate transporter receptor subunit TctC